MNGVLLRHQQPGGLGRAPRKPMPRGASRLVAKEPLSVRLPKADFSFLKYLAWPLLLAVLGYGAYRGAEYILLFSFLACHHQRREAIPDGRPRRRPFRLNGFFRRLRHPASFALAR